MLNEEFPVQAITESNFFVSATSLTLLPLVKDINTLYVTEDFFPEIPKKVVDEDAMCVFIRAWKDDTPRTMRAWYDYGRLNAVNSVDAVLIDYSAHFPGKNVVDFIAVGSGPMVFDPQARENILTEAWLSILCVVFSDPLSILIDIHSDAFGTNDLGYTMTITHVQPRVKH